MIDKPIKLLDCVDDKPAQCICAGIMWLATLGIIGGYIYHTQVEITAIKAGLVEKQKVGVSGTYWTKPD